MVVKPTAPPSQTSSLISKHNHKTQEKKMCISKNVKPNKCYKKCNDKTPSVKNMSMIDEIYQIYFPKEQIYQISVLPRSFFFVFDLTHANLKQKYNILLRKKRKDLSTCPHLVASHLCRHVARDKYGTPVRTNTYFDYLKFDTSSPSRLKRVQRPIRLYHC